MGSIGTSNSVFSFSVKVENLEAPEKEDIDHHKNSGESGICKGAEYIHAFDHNHNPVDKHPYFKVKHSFYFGGMKKKLAIPISTPERVIIHPNPPRQGFSKATWKGLNEYYL